MYSVMLDSWWMIKKIVPVLYTCTHVYLNNNWLNYITPPPPNTSQIFLNPLPHPQEIVYFNPKKSFAPLITFTLWVILTKASAWSKPYESLSSQLYSVLHHSLQRFFSRYQTKVNFIQQMLQITWSCTN